MKVDFRCVNSITEKVNSRGLKQVITEFTTKTGRKGTEIVTNLDYSGNKGIRTIDRNSSGKVELVVDDCYGRIEAYTSASPMYPKGVFQYRKNGTRTYIPHVSLENLSKY